MISIELKGIDKLMKMGERSPAIAEKYINKAISRALVRIFGEEKMQAPFGVTGFLRDRWDLKVGRFEGYLRSGVSYSVSVHEGTRPHYVSPQTLSKWAEKKGLNPFAVSKSIAKIGTRPNPFFQRAVDNTSNDVQKEFDNALVNITNELAQ